MSSAAEYAHHFSQKNVPFGIASSPSRQRPRAATRIGNTVIWLEALHQNGFFSHIEGLPDDALSHETLNSFASLPKSVQSSVRRELQDAFERNGIDAFPVSATEDIGAVTMHLPVAIGDFADFSCSLEHVKNAGRIIVNDERPPPAFFNFPIGYQGRASSIVVSGTEIERPWGQFRNPKAMGPDAPGNEPSIIFGPSQKMDYELELAAIIGKPLPMRQRLNAVDADEHIFGFVILNDWSSRDIQGFEMMPLGPFNGKSVGSTISPWVVTLDALEPFRSDGQLQRSVPRYLEDPDRGSYNITMKAEIVARGNATTVGTCKVQDLYWSMRQMTAHAVSSGASLRTGDVLATGTVSGPGEGALGCLLEITGGGSAPVVLKDGSRRAFLEDGDTVRMTAIAGNEDDGVGFGDCVGMIVPSRPYAE
ncbi:hypothetical protein VdG1_07753 [Verticillium dahliae VDG1]|nr:hypothetical protein VdG1_07753 [Verticillium dahliae VDG1]